MARAGAISVRFLDPAKKLWGPDRSRYRPLSAIPSSTGLPGKQEARIGAITMFEYEHNSHQQHNAPHKPHQHTREIESDDAPTATLDANEWRALGGFLDRLSPAEILSHTASLSEAYKLQTSIKTFVAALITAGLYRRI